jgi:DNA-binding NarL/FixJ family response regulator
MKLFIVDDSALINARVAQVALTIAGVVVTGSASSVDSALEGIAQTSPDALVLDVHLGDGSGLTVLAQSKQARPEIKSVVLTNESSEPYRRAAFDAGADHFLDKSTEFSQLSRILFDWSATGFANGRVGYTF